MTIRFARLLALCPLLLAACAGAANDDSLEAEEALGGACTGATCATLSAPAPLRRGGIAVSGSTLSWIARGSTMASDGRPVDELRQCALPACASQTTLTLKTADGKTIRPERASLRSAAGAVLFLGHIVGEDAYQLFLSNGQALQKVGPAMGSQHEFYEADDAGILVYSHDTRQDGWARGSLTSCAFQGFGPTKPCVTISDKPLNFTLNFALTPTRAVVERGGSVVSYDRATLADMRFEPITTGFTRSGFLTVGENVFSSEVSIRTRGGKVVHDMSVNGKAGSFIVNGVIRAEITDGAALFVGTTLEGDVFGIPRQGVIARYRPGQSRATTIARQQEVAAIAVDAKKVYWLDATGPDGDEDPVGTIRFAAK